MQILWGWAGESRVKLDLRVTPGLHLTAALVDPDRSKGRDVELTALDRPTATRKVYPYAPTGLDVYEGDLVFHADLAPARWPPARRPESGRSTYQPCTDDACLPLVTRTVEVVR